MDAKFWLDAAQFLLTAAVGIYIYFSNRSKATKKQLEEHAVMIATIEERLKASIGHSELAPVYDRINNIASNLSEIKGKMHTLDLIHEMLLKRES